MDIPVIASDQFKVKQQETSEIRASIYYKQLRENLAEEMLSNAVQCAQFYSDKFGNPLNKGKLIILCSPREGWGYSRIPLIVGPENYFVRKLESKKGMIEDFHMRKVRVLYLPLKGVEIEWQNGVCPNRSWRW